MKIFKTEKGLDVKFDVGVLHLPSRLSTHAQLARKVDLVKLSHSVPSRLCWPELAGGERELLTPGGRFRNLATEGPHHVDVLTTELNANWFKSENPGTEVMFNPQVNKFRVFSSVIPPYRHGPPPITLRQDIHNVHDRKGPYMRVEDLLFITVGTEVGDTYCVHPRLCATVTRLWKVAKSIPQACHNLKHAGYAHNYPHNGSVCRRCFYYGVWDREYNIARLDVLGYGDYVGHIRNIIHNIRLWPEVMSIIDVLDYCLATTRTQQGMIYKLRYFMRHYEMMNGRFERLDTEDETSDDDE
jgi:hypothetical protein